ncbi:MAG: RHS repeat-associated core domain-containing protein [Luteibacter sp.]|uniref:RHS repeat-associated core domain-containing protein n=1 Tax=Luteibacter sp. TaxID=1886636 RepID=UPI002807361E|nr:RHS repeat-associated core domain-containing protein [Luteibacter sp.]MDQ7994618.1 RHS repeat-associated core domain-containing protein [Luteibacter sp.]MDQ8048191.1 RHS repeat-associated core domain-containing protein [Luteibacter sp.]
MDHSTRLRARLGQLCVGFLLLCLWGIAEAGHAPIIFYNVPNWYSGGWDQIRYQTPYDAFAIPWNEKTHVYPTGCRDWTLTSVKPFHADGYEDGDFYDAITDTRNYDCSISSTGSAYPSGARRFAICGDSSAYSASAWPGGRCPELKPDPDKNRGAPTCPVCSVGDPVNPATGNKFETLALFSGQGTFPIRFDITYNGGQSAPILGPNQLSLGARRVHNYQMRVVVESNSTLTSAYVLRPDGKVYGFDQNGSTWTGDPDVADTLDSSRDVSGNITGWTYTRSDKTRETYDATGTLSAITRQDGLAQALAYDSQGHLSSITDPQGRRIVFTWDTSNRMVGMQDSAGGNYTFSYGANNNLVTLTYPDNSTRQFIYGENDGSTNFAGANDLTGQLDELGTRVDTTTYAQYYATVSSTVGAAGSNPTAVMNDPHGVQNSTQYAVVDSLGATETTTVSYMFGVSKPMTVTRTCDGCTTQTTTYTYDANGRIASNVDGNGNTTSTTYDANGLLLSKVDAKGSSDQRTTDTTWNTALRLPLVRTVKENTGKVVSKEGWAYNAAGQPTAQCLIDPAAAPSYTCAPTGMAPAGVRRSVMTYCTAVNTTTCPLVGLLLKTDGPRTDVTDTVSYAWYPTTDESGCATVGGACHHLGDLKSTTGGTGLVTTYVSYDKAGRVTRMKDPNGVLTDYTYTARGWLATKTLRANASGAPSTLDATTTIAYDPTGTVHSVTDADGVVTTYTYDAAHRLTDITDGVGARVHYTLDNAGNRTAEQVFDPAGTVVRSVGRTFNTLGQLTALTDGLNRTVFNAALADSYDANGNLVHSQDGLSVQQKQVYDGLNRLVSTLQDYQGSSSATANSQSVTSFDAVDRVVGVSDPDGLNTTYDIDALDNAKALHSPDTGTSSLGFDISGNPVNSVDAVSISTASTYDALGRRTARTYADTTLNVAYKFDEADSVTSCTGSVGKGRLTRVIEGNGGLVYCYDRRGNVVKKQQTVGTETRTTVYTWTPGNRLKSVTTANGTVVAYARDGAGRINSVTATPSGGTATTVASNVTYQPFGPVASYKLGNSQTVTRTFDATGQLTDIASTAFSLHLKRDAMGNVIALGDTAGVATPAETYGYDALYRLTGVNAADGKAVEAYTYNKTGDRLSKVAPGMLTGSYTYKTGTHQLTGVGTTTRQVDARGNTTANVLASGTYGFGYNQRNRLTVVQNGGATVGSYVLNALGQRVQKVAGGVSTRFDYDEDSRLLGESTGAATRDYIWMEGLPVGVVDRNGTAATVNFIHADGLGSPRVVTNAAGTVLWQWAYAGNPFGEKAPVSSSGYVLNLRYPGQYFDAESGLAYNVNRDYEAATGRYIQSDPVGLEGGTNTYAYALSNPMLQVDPKGTCIEDACVIEGAAVYEVISWGWASLGGASILSMSTMSNVDRVQKALDRREYTQVCKTPPPKTGDKCKDAKANIVRLKQCLQLREAYSAKWYDDGDPGHMTEIANTRRAIEKLEDFVRKNCGDGCEK